ncbi:MAG: Cof-type HAD-IIB family hydrolase [Gaiellaceae bacterium]
MKLPADFPRSLTTIACDLDRTLLAEDYVLHPRTRAAIDAARTRRLRFVVVTGRMFQSVRRYLTGPEPVICYQGALVVDPTTGEFLRHVPIPLDLAREAIAVVQAAGYGLNCYVDDELYVERVTPAAEQYASFQLIELHTVGPLLEWLDRPPTKLVVIGDPAALDELGAQLRRHFGEGLFIAKSLPFFLELAHPDVSKGSGLQFVADLLGFTREETIAFGDGENDLELLDWAGYAVAVENANPAVRARANLIAPPVDEEGVAQTIEAFLAR